MTAPDASDARRGAAWGAVGVAATLAALLAWVPWQPRLPDAGLDPSWAYALHLARAAGRRFGRDVVFTYGPLGYVYTGMYHPATFAEMLAGWALVAVAAALAATWLARRREMRPAGALAWLLGLVAVASLDGESRTLVLPLLLLATHAAAGPPPPPALRWLLLAGNAVVGLMKFSTLLATATAVGVVAVHEVAVRRRVPAIVLEYAVALGAAWCLTQPSLAGVGAYLASSWEMASGYAAAMWSDGPAWEVAAGAVVAAVVLGIAAGAELRARGRRALPFVAGLGVLVALAFRTGFVRHDVGHVQRCAVSVLLVAVLQLPLWWRGERRQRRVALAVLLAAATFASGAVSRLTGLGLAAQLLNVATDVPRLGLAAARALAGTHGFAALANHRLRTQRMAHPVPPVPEPTDISPVEITVLAAHGLEYAPRPVFQSYAAYTPRLAEMNAAQLRGPAAPAGVLLRVGATDGRPPMLDDGPWWLELLARYRLTDFAGAYLAWSRVAAAAPPRLTPLAVLDARLGDRLALPEFGGAPIRASVDVEPSVLGRLALACLKSSGLLLDVETADGERVTWRLVPGAARAGFLLSPFLGSTLDVAALVSVGGEDVLAGRDVVALRVRPVAGGGAFHRPEVRVRLDRVDVPRRPLPDEPQLRVLRSRLDLLRAARPHAHLVSSPVGEELIGAHAPATLTVPCPAGATRLRLRFGIVDEAWRSGSTDGVDFAAVAVGAGGAERALWSRRLDPGGRADDRGMRSARVDVPRGTTAVRLETRPGRTDAFDWAYWAEAAFE